MPIINLSHIIFASTAFNQYYGGSNLARNPLNNITASSEFQSQDQVDPNRLGHLSALQCMDLFSHGYIRHLQDSQDADTHTYQDVNKLITDYIGFCQFLVGEHYLNHTLNKESGRREQQCKSTVSNLIKKSKVSLNVSLQE